MTGGADSGRPGRDGPDKNPWLKFYPSDWRADPRLRLCGLAARGLWMEMIALMHEATPYGHLLIGGLVPNDAQLAALTGCTAAQVVPAREELEQAGVFSRTAEGVIFSRRMVRDHGKTLTARSNGRKGGNPALAKTAEGPPGSKLAVKKGVKRAVKPQSPEDQSPESQSPEGQKPNDPKPNDPKQDDQKSGDPNSGDPSLGDPSLGATEQAAVARLIAAFDAAVVRAWGPEFARPWPRPTDAPTARDALRTGAALGLSAAQVEAIAETLFNSRMAGLSARGRPPPKVLSFFAAALSETLSSEIPSEPRSATGGPADHAPPFPPGLYPPRPRHRRPAKASPRDAANGADRDILHAFGLDTGRLDPG